MFFFVTSSAHANLVFSLAYNSTDSTATKSDAVGYALGTFELNKAAGGAFTVLDLVALDISVHTTNTFNQKYLLPSLLDIFFSEQNSNLHSDVAGVIFEGKISNDGLTVSFTDIFLKNGVAGFGCNMFDCISGGVIQVIGNDTSGNTLLSDLFKYDTQENIHNSFKTTLHNAPNVTIPEPSTIIVFALGTMALILRRFKQP